MGKNMVSHFQKETTLSKNLILIFNFSTNIIFTGFQYLIGFSGSEKGFTLGEVKSFVLSIFYSTFKPDEKGAEAPDLVWVELPHPPSHLIPGLKAGATEGRGYTRPGLRNTTRYEFDKNLKIPNSKR